MSETLTIKNFGPIKDMSFEFKKINIFIGDQSTGKSTVAKLLMAIKEVLIADDSNNKSHESRWNLIYFRDQLEIYSITNYLNPQSYIEFSNSYESFKYDNQDIAINKNPEKNRDKNTNIGGFIPSYREAAILLKNSINALAGLKVPITEWFYFFGQKLLNAKLSKGLYDYTQILDIKYKYANDTDIIILKNGDEIKIEEASSAINSGIPMLLVFDNAVESMYPTRNRIYHFTNRPYIIIEEPELNCFPTTQKKIMEHFVPKIKFETKDGFDYYCALVITTHSPYILTSLNNMMYGYTVGQNEPLEVNKIINQKYWINPDDVSAYMLLTDGTCEDIVDREEGLIKAEKIDDVTNILNEQFSSLLSLQFSENEFDTK